MKGVLFLSNDIVIENVSCTISLQLSLMSVTVGAVHGLRASSTSLTLRVFTVVSPALTSSQRSALV